MIKDLYTLLSELSRLDTVEDTCQEDISAAALSSGDLKDLKERRRKIGLCSIHLLPCDEKLQGNNSDYQPSLGYC